MPTKSRVVPGVAALLWFGLLFSSSASAVDTRLTERAQDRSGGYTLPSSVWPAPTGHRQPRAADIPANIPKDDFDERLEQIHRELDRKVQICRGC
jgi:hypothetical protein